MRRKPQYDQWVEQLLDQHGKVLNEFRVWCFRKDAKFDQNLLADYLEDIGIKTAIITVGHKRYRWEINDIEYVNYSYRVSKNAHLSCLIKCIQMRQQQLES